MTRLWGVKLANLPYVIGPDAVTEGSTTWQPFSCPYFEFADLDDPALASVRVEARPVPSDLSLLVQLGRLVGSRAELWRLEDSGGGFTATKVWTGAILRSSIGKQNNLVMELGPQLAAFAATIPRQFGPLCRYMSTSECSYALTCAKSWAACTANGQNAIFGGFRWIPPAGTRIVIRETMETVR